MDGFVTSATRNVVNLLRDSFRARVALSKATPLPRAVIPKVLQAGLEKPSHWEHNEKTLQKVILPSELPVLLSEFATGPSVQFNSSFCPVLLLPLPFPSVDDRETNKDPAC